MNKVVPIAPHETDTTMKSSNRFHPLERFTVQEQRPVGSFGVRALDRHIEVHSQKLKRKFRTQALTSLEYEEAARDALSEMQSVSAYRTGLELGEFETEELWNARGKDLRQITTRALAAVNLDAYLCAVSKQRAALTSIAAKVDLIEKLTTTSATTKIDARKGNEGGEAKNVIEAALCYMRMRNGDAYERAMGLVDRLNISQQRSAASLVRSRITVYEGMRVAYAMTGGRPSNLMGAVLMFSEPRHMTFHSIALSSIASQYRQELVYERMSRCNTKLVPQSLFDFKENNKLAWKVWLDGFKKVWGSFHKLIGKTGLVGVLLTYIFLYKVLLFVNIKLNRWVYVAILAVCNKAYIRLIIEDIAETISTDCAKDVAKMTVPTQRAFFKTAEKEGSANKEHTAFYEYNLHRRTMGLEPTTFDEFINISPDQCSPHAMSASLKLLSLTAFSTLIGKRIPLYTKIVNAQKFRSGLEELYDGGSEAFEKLANLILRSCGSKTVLNLKKGQSIVKRRACDVEKFCRDARGGGLTLDESAHLKYMQFYSEASAEVANWPRDSYEWRCASRTLDELVKLSVDYPAHFNEAKARIEPIGFMMSGPPGIGKTHLLTLLSQIIAKYERPDEDFDMSRHTFQKPPGQYWEGYKGQLILCLDDVFTKQPVAGEQEGDAEMIVKLINQWPLSLNMANCALKGRFYMTAPYVLGTTNMMSDSALSKAVVDPQAIIRRFPFWYDVTLKPGKRCEADCDPDETWDFRLKNFASPTSNEGPSLSFTEVVQRLFEERKRRVLFFERSKHNKNYCERIANYMREQVPVVPQGAVASAARGVCCAATPCIRPVVVAASSVYTSARLLSRVAKKTAAQILDDSANTIKAVGAATMCYALLTVALATAFIIIVARFAGKKNDGKVKAQSHHDEVVGLVQRNMFTVSCDDLKLGYALALDDMTLVMPSHFWRQCVNGGGSLIATSSKGHTLTLTRPKKECSLTDQVFFRVKTQCKSLVSSHVSTQPQEKRLLIVFPDRVMHAETTHEVTLCEYADPYSHNPKQRVLYSHTAKLDAGDCGAIVMGATGKYGRRVYGMHTAGTEDRNCAYSGRFTGFRLTPCIAQSLATFQGHTVITQLEKPIHNGGDTRLEPTPYQGTFGGVKTAPSAKRPAGGVDPMLKAISGYKREWSDPPPEIFKCVDAVMAEVHTAIRDYDVRPVDAWTAAAGIEGLPYCKGLPRGKSPGYPFILKYKDKKKMLGAEGPYVKGPAWGELEDAVNDLRSKYERGERGAVFRDSLKDEPRKLSKVEECATRMISGCAVEMAVVGRQETLLYTSAIMQTRHDHGIMPGLNPYGVEARQLYDRFAHMNKSARVTAGDYKEYDKSQHPAVTSHIWRRVSEFLVARGGNAKVLRGLGEDTIRARHLGGTCFASDIIYEVDGTLPSGHWMTSILNSFYNASVMRYCWVKQKGLSELFNFRQNVAAVYYGDDFLSSPNDKHLDFGLGCLQKWVANLGLKMTDEDGNENGADFKGVDEVTFLCRRFRVDDDGVAWMALDLDSIYDMFNWKKKSTSTQEHTEAIVRASLLELAAHDYAVFDEHYGKIKQIAEGQRIRLFELALDPKEAYAHWRVVHKGHVPIWTPDGDEQSVSVAPQSTSRRLEPMDLQRVSLFYNFVVQNDLNSPAVRYIARTIWAQAFQSNGRLGVLPQSASALSAVLSMSDDQFSRLQPAQLVNFYSIITALRLACVDAGCTIEGGVLIAS